ncbi:MAG: phosphoribosylformylglycinamidine synthase subunit PurS [Candidatus Methylomirabilales bacterium]
MLKAKVTVTLKPGILDPQGETIRGALESLGFREVTDVRVGKLLLLTLQETLSEAVRERVEEMCRKLLANPVIEEYRYAIDLDGPGVKEKVGAPRRPRRKAVVRVAGRVKGRPLRVRAGRRSGPKPGRGRDR